MRTQAIIKSYEDKGSYSCNIHIERGLFYYRVMPFGLKNRGTTYQMLMNEMFTALLGKTMEIYIDDMVVKSKE